MSAFSLKANLTMEEGVYWSLKDSLPGIEGRLKMCKIEFVPSWFS